MNTCHVHDRGMGLDQATTPPASSSPLQAREHQQTTSRTNSPPVHISLIVVLRHHIHTLPIESTPSMGMVVEMAPNPFISTQKAADTSLQVALHPLVLLTISDYITRHTLRQQTGPVVGALLGQQNGREITIEHAFDCKTMEGEAGVILHKAWFEERLQQSESILL